MARPAAKHPTDAEFEILKILWEQGPVGLGAICEAIRTRRPVAPSTVATVLKVMLDKEQVRRKTDPSSRGSLWSARLTRAAAERRLTGDLVDRMFDGSAQRLVAHLIERQGLGDADLEHIQSMLDAYRARTERESS